ncbi:protein of unknown function DUF2292 [Geotalea daltonii FRC-32]|uniref:DUF2292 domain-containing protein n=1 Tax=Geotalea daltonii (strain DSM 22248 / JCM 15807 / FRC-32) TaxID=316067 RepID=B9M027_GEODF|nr:MULTISPECIES: YezD family protein [Geotalea]ACM20807.1 protein of unknown function DUF2292 [Geotalea daltonii FRC-32]
MGDGGVNGTQEQWNVELERKIRNALQSIKFGTVTLVIQDGKVIQIDKNEKIRLT